MAHLTGLTWETCPVCPNCGKMPWRKEHLNTCQVETPNAEEQDGPVTVCMHCAKMWVLAQSGSGAFSWRQPSNKERDRILSDLHSVVQTFTRNIANAARMN